MDFAQQVDLMVARLHACIAGKPAGSNEGLPLLGLVVIDTSATLELLQAEVNLSINTYL
jgi:hypothetical protein